MTYEESFLSTCDAEGSAPPWAIKQIFQEHRSTYTEFLNDTNEKLWFDGEAILNYLGY